MNGLDNNEILQWILRHLPADTKFDFNRLRITDAPGYRTLRCDFPSDSGRKAYLARGIRHVVKAEPRLLLCVRNWDVFPSSGHLPLFVRLRESLGERRPVEEAPGHLFDAAEADDIISVLVLALEFFWDCFAMGESGTVAVKISHDEYVDVLSSVPSTVAGFEELFRRIESPPAQ
jgi:hypothetical protein